MEEEKEKVNSHRRRERKNRKKRKEMFADREWKNGRKRGKGGWEEDEEGRNMSTLFGWQNIFGPQVLFQHCLHLSQSAECSDHRECHTIHRSRTQLL